MNTENYSNLVICFCQSAYCIYRFFFSLDVFFLIGYFSLLYLCTLWCLDVFYFLSTRLVEVINLNLNVNFSSFLHGKTVPCWKKKRKISANGAKFTNIKILRDTKRGYADFCLDLPFVIIEYIISHLWDRLILSSSPYEGNKDFRNVG